MNHIQQELFVKNKIETINFKMKKQLDNFARINVRLMPSKYVEGMVSLAYHVLAHFQDFSTDRLLTIGFHSKDQVFHYYFHKDETDRDANIEQFFETTLTLGKANWNIDNLPISRTNEMNFVFRSIYGFMIGKLRPFKITVNQIETARRSRVA